MSKFLLICLLWLIAFYQTIEFKNKSIAYENNFAEKKKTYRFNENYNKNEIQLKNIIQIGEYYMLDERCIIPKFARSVDEMTRNVAKFISPL